jgi:hypothetical protein
MVINNKYNLNRRAPTVYVNLFTGQATTQFPGVTESTRGGVSLFQRLLTCFFNVLYSQKMGSNVQFFLTSCFLSAVMSYYMMLVHYTNIILAILKRI